MNDTNVYEHVHWSIGAQHPLVARDVILGHIGGLASESSAYTLYGIHKPVHARTHAHTHTHTHTHTQTFVKPPIYAAVTRPDIEDKAAAVIANQVNPSYVPLEQLMTSQAM